MVKAIYFLNRHRTRKLIPDVCSVSLDTRSFSMSILFKTKSPQLQQLFYIVWEIFPMESWKCISSCIQFEGNKTFNLFRFDMRWNRKSKSAKKSKNIYTNLWVEAKQVKNLLNYFKYQVLSRSFESILLLLFSFPKPLQNSLCIYEIARLRDRRTTNLGRTWQPGLLGGIKPTVKLNLNWLLNCVSSVHCPILFYIMWYDAYQRFRNHLQWWWVTGYVCIFPSIPQSEYWSRRAEQKTKRELKREKNRASPSEQDIHENSACRQP